MSFRLSLTSLAALIVATPALADPMFNRIAAFPVANNLPEGEDHAAETSAEIMAVTEDGNMLVYSDSPHGAIGMVDITDPKMPKAAGHVDMEGEPTTTVIIGGNAFVGVNTSESYTAPSGALRVVDLASKTVTESCDLGGQPDSVARANDGSAIAVAIENERDEDLNDGEIPQMPAGFVVKLPVKDGALDCAGKQVIEVTGAATAGDDPEPEFLDFNDAGEIVLTLQENNANVVIGADNSVTILEAGTVDLDGIDIEKDGKITPTASLKAVPREPDAVDWIDNDHFVTANEGDWKGGSRGFTIWNKDGSVVYEDAAALEREIIAIGHYPEKRSGKKGSEPEAVKVASYGDQKLLFVASERGSVVGVYDLADLAAPKLLQILPSGIGPEGLVAIPSRNLFATANEVDLGEDGAARAHVMLYERAEGEASYPTLRANEGIGWGALSGLALADGKAYAVSDSFYSAAPSIYEIDPTTTPATITRQIVVTRDGAPAEKLDLEGIISDGQGGFWLASEGHPKKEVPALVLHVDAEGAIQKEIALPEALAGAMRKHGFEGIEMIDGKLWVAVQRAWEGDPENHAKLLQIDPESGEFKAMLYPLESGEGWVGLSDLSVHGDYLYVIERDNQIGDKAALKQITRIKLADLAPADLGGELPVVTKEVVRDLIPDLQAWNGYVVDKVEGLAIAEDGTAWLATDNDGVDDSSGETFFWSVKLN